MSTDATHWISKRARQHGPDSLRSFGKRNAHKPVKAVFGLALMVVLSVTFYEVDAHKANLRAFGWPAKHSGTAG